DLGTKGSHLHLNWQNEVTHQQSQVETGETSVWRRMREISPSLLPRTDGFAVTRGSPPIFFHCTAGTANT
ncbi:hypothetical protein HAX54_040598, partial [Datura stramonium]|nr:hypothetical protein [Datura stramonium]